VRFLGKTFKLAVEDFPTIQIFFLSSKVLEGLKYAKKRGYQANFEKGRFSSHSSGQDDRITCKFVKSMRGHIGPFMQSSVNRMFFEGVFFLIDLKWQE
jgi:hypothetical protein